MTPLSVKGSFCHCEENRFGGKRHYCGDPGRYNGGLGKGEVVECGHTLKEEVTELARAWMWPVMEREVVMIEGGAPGNTGHGQHSISSWWWVTASILLICFLICRYC